MPSPLLVSKVADSSKNYPSTASLVFYILQFLKSSFHYYYYYYYYYYYCYYDYGYDYYYCYYYYYYYYYYYCFYQLRTYISFEGGNRFKPVFKGMSI